MDTQQVQIQIDQAKQIARIEELCENMNSRLFGNGQPGVIREFDNRLKSLEKDRNIAKGGFAVMSAFLTFVGWTHVRDLFR